MRPNASFFASISSPTPPFRRPRRAQRRSRARRRPPSSCSAPPRSCAAPPPLDFLPLFGAASTASRRAQAPLNRPTTPYQSRPGHPPRCPPSFPRLPRPDRSAPSRACSRRDATRPCMPSATASRAWAVAQAVAPQHRPLAATSTSTTGASRTPCLVRRVRQSPGDATDCDTSASRPRLAHDRVVHVECRLPLQLRRDRAAGLPSAIAQPHPLRKAIATFLPDGRSATPENQTWRETLRSVRC